MKNRNSRINKSLEIGRSAISFTTKCLISIAIACDPVLWNAVRNACQHLVAITTLLSK